MNSRPLQPIARESTPCLIAAQLRQHIAEGALAPGEQLVEMEIAHELGVSRGPVREAIQRLTQEGLVVSIRNKGVFVSEFEAEDLLDIYEARTAVEKSAALLLCSRDRLRAGDELLRCVERMAEASTAEDLGAMSEADIAFHEKLVEMAASPRLSRMHATLLTETRMCLNRLEGRYNDESIRVSEHRGIAEAIREGNEDLAMRRLELHKEDALGRLLHLHG
ncbi:GntR family transcriptional regulator [Sinomonas mesophila]|uniref:GntR family transcriptional regulator n=1 Tax=Sinomonas mesophila TaxID=1531955 RepID=UPI000985E24A|nr:GntR family transcriptional regulator [Sinomonas mesophila]